MISPEGSAAGLLSVNLLQNACQKENERISTKPFLLWHFSSGDKIENCSAQFLAVCWIVHVEFEVHRLRDGFGVSYQRLRGLARRTGVGRDL